MDLTSNDYYELNYSLIPDNIYQQIVGVTKKIEYSAESTYESPSAIDKAWLKYKGGRTEYIQLPFFDVHSFAPQNFYTDVYNAVITYHDEGSLTSSKERTEKISVMINTSVASDVPIRYIPTVAEMEAFDVTGYTWSKTAGWGYTVWGARFNGNTNELQIPANYAYGADGTYSETELSECEIEKVVIDSYYDGSRLNAAGLYEIRMQVYVFAYNAKQVYTTDSWTSSASLEISMPSSFKLRIPYFAATEVDEEFEYHVDTIDYENYPLKIQGNYLTTRNTVYDSDTPWDEFISDVLLDKYENGKLWVSAKVKASFLISNDLSIDSVISIKKLNGNYISRFGTTLSFQLKNIEFKYNGSQFIANIILLEV